jgi:hypothetical protein
MNWSLNKFAEDNLSANFGSPASGKIRLWLLQVLFWTEGVTNGGTAG